MLSAFGLSSVQLKKMTESHDPSRSITYDLSIKDTIENPVSLINKMTLFASFDRDIALLAYSACRRLPPLR